MKKMSLGQYIAARRKKMFMTQEELADKLHVSKSAIAKWETDGGIPDRDNLYGLAEVMGVSVDDMHRFIRRGEGRDEDYEINITPEIIELLESYGYEIKRPEKRRKPL